MNGRLAPFSPNVALMAGVALGFLSVGTVYFLWRSSLPVERQPKVIPRETMRTYDPDHDEHEELAH